MELFDGRPQDITGHLPREIRVYDFLDDLGIEYKRTDHADATDEKNKEIFEMLSLDLNDLFS